MLSKLNNLKFQYLRKQLRNALENKGIQRECDIPSERKINPILYLIY